MPAREWLEPDGLGGFASGTVDGVRTRRYHALLLASTQPPTGRFVLVNGFDAWVQTGAGLFALTSQRYDPGVVHPDGTKRISDFRAEPWPRWTYLLEDGTEIEHELLVGKDAPRTALCWRSRGRKRPVSLEVRPFISGRDYHALQVENAAFAFEPERRENGITFRPYGGVPAIQFLTNGTYHRDPHWYRGFVYEDERARGLDFREDLASPGVLRFELNGGDAVLVVGAEMEGAPQLSDVSAVDYWRRLAGEERKRRQAFPSRLHRCADAYLVRRGRGKTILAGYPWFTDWGRDTFIALRGLCLATGRLDEAGQILIEWAGAVSQGMLPNRFPDRAGDAPEYNAVDASLWYVVAVYELLEAKALAGSALPAEDEGRLREALLAIVAGYGAGTRHGIRLDSDGLLAAGVAGQQLTWMDARVGDREITPRIGKPVEVQALWLNALRIASQWEKRWEAVARRGLATFADRFPNSAGYLNDVVDVNHQSGTRDAAFRPNQILAVGGLPFSVLVGEPARRVVDQVEERLLTPLGLRSLAPGEPGYAARYEGGPHERDAAYHQGTVWPWLLGPFVEAWVRVRGATAEAKREARRRFLDPLLQHLDEAGLGHISEVADADAPHVPNGCPFQAWSLGEALRLDRVVLASDSRGRSKARKTRIPPLVTGIEAGNGGESA